VAKKIFGTPAITGLNIKRGSHLIEDNELVESVNGWTDEDGVWSVARRPERLYSGSDIVAYEAGRMGGADHHVYLDGSTLYDNGVSVGTINGVGDTMEISAIDDQFLITGATKSHIYDGDQVREQGTWQPSLNETNIFSINVYTPEPFVTITAITKASPAEVTTSAPHGLDDGQWVYMENVVGMPEVDDRMFSVTVVDTTHFTINEDSSGFVAVGTAGDLTLRANLVGDYKFYMTYTVELTDGTILESKPRGLNSDNAAWLAADEDPWDAEVFTLAATDSVKLSTSGRAFWEYDSTYQFDIDGTIGVDYFPGIRVYRTKANGYDVYREKAWRHGDSDFNYLVSAPNTVYYPDPFWFGAPDNRLGAVLPYSFNDHISAPATEIATFAGQRTFVAVATFAGQRTFVAVGKYLHWSSFDGMEYYSDAGNVLMWDTITALGSYRDYCIVFSADRMWAVRMINGVPDIEEIDTPVGTTYPLAVEQTSMGLMFLREDGLWLFAGGTVEKISRRAFKDLVSPKSVSMAGDVLYVSGSEQAFVAINRGDSWIWHESSYYLPYASSTSGKLYAASTYSVDQLFLGARSSGSFKTKGFGSMDLSMNYKLEMDIEGESIPSVAVNGNVVSDTAWHLDDTPYSFAGRRIVWTWLPRILSNYFEIECDVSGDVKVNGFRGYQSK
jgi:hypothetical protein